MPQPTESFSGCDSAVSDALQRVQVLESWALQSFQRVALRSVTASNWPFIPLSGAPHYCCSVFFLALCFYFYAHPRLHWAFPFDLCWHPPQKKKKRNQHAPAIGTLVCSAVSSSTLRTAYLRQVRPAVPLTQPASWCCHSHFDSHSPSKVLGSTMSRSFFFFLSASSKLQTLTDFQHPFCDFSL